MTTSAKIIADSIAPTGIRLTTLELRYQRFIHAEFMTHRVFERNASSSRAIPVERLIQDVLDDPAMPIHWGSNKPGMQAGAELDRRARELAIETWMRARDQAVTQARQLAAIGAHKQIVNRLLEPFAHINVVVTATDWANFFALRDHPDAQPEIAELARQMRTVMQGSTPRKLEYGEWHLPYVDDEDWNAAGYHVGHLSGYVGEEVVELLRKVSAARCARVSYKTHEGKRPTIEADLALYERLVGGDVVHATPTGHQAAPDYKVWVPFGTEWAQPLAHGPFRGWIQHRKLIPNEAVRERAA